MGKIKQLVEDYAGRHGLSFEEALHGGATLADMLADRSPRRDDAPATGWTAEIQDDDRSSFRALDYFRASIRDGRGQVIAHLPELGDEETNAELVGNARLIAAAPDLLAACRAFTTWDTDPHATEVDAAELRRLVAGAIRAAEGDGL